MQHLFENETISVNSNIGAFNSLYESALFRTEPGKRNISIMNICIIILVDIPWTIWSLVIRG